MGWSLLFEPQNKEVAQKLGIATALMFTVPITVFYFCLTFVFHEKEDPEMWAGLTAVVTVNLVIAGYVYSAFSEEDEFTTTSEGDAAGPRVGAFKQRTD
mmetsp:Transcript_9390/g.12615  ORF Transcript_9390/g.12615 Transcript_9390/m.12615 type:complete len:99 (+) Transcript_9390:51-347(+)